MNIVFNMAKSEAQKRLERQGCFFLGQELMDRHELDPDKPCYCGRPNSNEPAK